jgi:competence protein ComFC
MRWLELRNWPAVLAGTALDWLYPPVCAVCEEVQSGGRMLCEGCGPLLPRLVEPFCRKCGEHFDGRLDEAFVCPNCGDLKFAFEFARPAMMLDERTRGMIHRLKYGRGIHLADELGKLAAEAFLDERLAMALREKWPLVPVPLHRSRRAWRHFNQAEEIAMSVSRRTGLPLLDALKRTRATTTQTSLSRAKRLENLRGAFAIRRVGDNWAAKNGAILVDDVLTTGSTLDACARVLRKSGFRTVVAIAVMRG